MSTQTKIEGREGKRDKRGKHKEIEREGKRTGMPVMKAERIKPHDDASPTMIFAVCIRERGFTPGNLGTGHDG